MASRRLACIKGCRYAVRDQYGFVWCAYNEESIGTCSPEFCPRLRRKDLRSLKVRLEVCFEGLAKALLVEGWMFEMR